MGHVSEKAVKAYKGGQNRNDCRMILAKRHEHIANIRRDFWHKITDWLVRHYGLIALEHLDLAFMTRNTHLSLSAHDAGLGLFNDLLCFKAVEAGCALVQVNPRNTSQRCSGAAGAVRCCQKPCLFGCILALIVSLNWIVMSTPR